MDAAGIDLQVISHSAPAMQKMTDAEAAVRLARRANDRLAEAVRAHPTRFAGFAALPTPDPKAAADELERAVTQLGFKGAMIHGLTNGRFHDEKEFWPIFERAQALDVPIYFHPSVPAQPVIDTYYTDYLQDVPGILRAAWGFTVETATQGVRMVLSGVFDAYPGLKVILGHLGEGLPFYAWRINMALERDWKPSRSFREVFARAFLRHHERLLVRPGAAVLHPGTGAGPHHVLGGLPVRAEPAGDGMAAQRAALRRGPREAGRRECEEAAEAVKPLPRARERSRRAATRVRVIGSARSTCTAPAACTVPARSPSPNLSR